MKDDGERLREQVKLSRLSATEIAEKTGISRTMLYNLFNHKEISAHHKESLRNAGIVLDKSEQKSNTHVFFGNSKPNMIVVPLKAQGGFLQGYENKVYLDTLEWTAFPFVKGECFAFEVEGFSMMPDYPPGSFVVGTKLESLTYLQKGKDYVLQTIDGLILKRYAKMEDGGFHFKSLNTEYTPIKIPVKHLKAAYFIEQKIIKP